MNTKPLTKTREWKALKEHFGEVRKVRLRDLFRDEKRFESFSIKDEKLGLLFDYSKHLATKKTLSLLFKLAEKSEVREWARKMFEGEKINWTEDRAVLHTALRKPPGEKVFADGRDVLPGIHNVLERVKVFSENVRNGGWKGATGKRIENLSLIHISEPTRPY